MPPQYKTSPAPHTANKEPLTKKPDRARWYRSLLLCILGYEGAGCLFGAGLLIAAPDGSLMNMPVYIMRGFFSNFLIPGIILLGLGILNLAALYAVWRRASAGWVIVGLALGGLLIWFLVEIAILQKLHWLHAMWGLPVVIGCWAAVPMFRSRHPKV